EDTTPPPPPPPSLGQSPVVLNDFGWAQGWGGAGNPRLVADANGDGTLDYVGFGYSSTFIAYGGTFSGGGSTGPGFTAATRSANGFQILKTSPGDAAASILGFGYSGIVVGPQAFAAGATAAASYVIPLAAGNAFGWDQTVDIRSFTDLSGKTIDLNSDGIADFVGMGPAGLVYAYGNTSGSGGAYGLGSLQTAHISGGSTDLGEAQGWTDATTPRYIIADSATGYDDILAFGAAGVYAAMGQNPATHGGEPFGQMYLAMADFGSSQGWSVGTTPRLVGDVTGDGIPDIVAFG